MHRWVVGLVFFVVGWAVSAKPVICLDPGHPSEIGPGTRGKRITELEAVWLVAKELEPLLKNEGYTVVMTKKSMREKVTNKRRAEIANAAKADLMLRLHCDYAPGESGFATFFADRQGRDGKVTGPSKEVLQRVKPMASAFHQALGEALAGSLKDRGLRTEQKTAVGAKKGALVGSIHSKVPSILVEMAVLNNDSDDRFMASAAGRTKMARALVAGVKAALAAGTAKR